jgi:teichuronic acid biosynthesis glycosyltransferase TuaC
MSYRVLVISHMYPNEVNPMSGIFVHNECKALQQQGITVKVLSPIPSFPLYPKWKGYRHMSLEAEREGIPVTYVPTRMFPGGFFFFTYGELYLKSLVPAIEKIKSDFPFDLLHCHTIFPDGYAGGKLKQIFQVPVVSTIHGSDIMLYPKRNRATYNKTVKALEMVDQVVTVSQRLLTEAKKMLPQLNGETIYNGFDPKRFAPIDQKEARKSLQLPENRKILLFVGNLYPVKGVPFLLQAFAKIAAKDSNLHLYLIGDGPLRPTLNRLVKELGITEQVSFMGRRPYDEIPLWINSADLLALSSLSEGLPSILLESMGCAKPMVATNVGGISEVLQDGQTGLLVESRHVEQLTGALQRLLIDEPDLLLEMGKKAYQASQKLTWFQHASRIKQLYQQLLAMKAT